MEWMSIENYLEYRETVARIGKALALPEEVRKKHQKTFDQLREQVQKDWKGYCMFALSAGENDWTAADLVLLMPWFPLLKEAGQDFLTGKIEEGDRKINLVYLCFQKIRGKKHE